MEPNCLVNFFTLKGLKCGPAALQLSDKLPNWWMWTPWRPGVRPWIVPLTMTGPPVVVWVKWNWPLTPGNLVVPLISTTAETGRCCSHAIERIRTINWTSMKKHLNLHLQIQSNRLQKIHRIGLDRRWQSVKDARTIRILCNERLEMNSNFKKKKRHF